MDRLLIATGAAARPFPQLDKLGDRCFTLRHAGDAERLRDNLLPGKSIVIVGAGTNWSGTGGQRDSTRLSGDGGGAGANGHGPQRACSSARLSASPPPTCGRAGTA